jgi:hypothetical protein
MSKLVAKPTGFIINHYNMVVSVEEDDGRRVETIQKAKFIEVAFCITDEETGDEFYSLANTYSMN